VHLQARGHRPSLTRLSPHLPLHYSLDAGKAPAVEISKIRPLFHACYLWQVPDPPLFPTRSDQNYCVRDESNNTARSSTAAYAALPMHQMQDRRTFSESWPGCGCVNGVLLYRVPTSKCDGRVPRIH
jgi:hypothetical protein